MSAKMMVYGCGGCGINLVQEHIVMPKIPTQPEYDCVRVDMSDANIDPDVALPYYLIPGVKGSGKNRTLGHSNAQPYMTDILAKHKPGTINVVLYSASGGSGSVLGPLLTAELLRRGCPTVVFLVGSTTSGKETDNTYKSLMTLQHQVKQLNVPIALAYYENARSPSDIFKRRGLRSDIDGMIYRDIITLSLIASEKHLELDREDFTNFLNYPAVTDVPPQLTELIIAPNDVVWDTYVGNVISTASVMSNKDRNVPELKQPYSCEGYYQEEVIDEYGDELVEVTAALSSIHIAEYAKNLKEELEQFKQSTLELSANTGIDVTGDSMSDDLIL